MTKRTVSQQVQGMATQDGAGVSLKRILGQRALPRLDPFLMLDEFGSDQPQDYIAGFPPHPHRGFQTVTYMLEGKMQHKDSVGNTGIIEDGGIQWMNAGKGIIHEEMPMQTEGMMRGFQLWVNLPASEKMSQPNYQDIKADLVPLIKMEEGVQVKVLAGEFQGIAGPVNTQAVAPIFFDVSLEQGKEVILPVELEHNVFVYCYEGDLDINSTRVRKGHLAVLSAGDEVAVKFAPRLGNTHELARFILVAGKPIAEPVVQYGPFVMNTEAEIHQALQDFKQGNLA